MRASSSTPWPARISSLNPAVYMPLTWQPMHEMPLTMAIVLECRAGSLTISVGPASMRSSVLLTSM